MGQIPRSIERISSYTYFLQFISNVIEDIKGIFCGLHWMHTEVQLIFLSYGPCLTSMQHATFLICLSHLVQSMASSLFSLRA